MTNTSSVIAETDTAAAVQAGIEIAGPQEIGDSGHHFTQVVPEGAEVTLFDLRALDDELAAHPRRKTGTVHVQDAASFVAYLEKHRIPASEVYADLSRMALVGVINAHGESVPGDNQPGTAGHGDHQVRLELLPTDMWQIWTGQDKKLMDQERFAEHLEDNAADVVEPDAATMLEIAQSLHATNSAQFKSGIRLDSGEITFRYEETISAKAGQTGDIDIPSTFVIAIAPFEGANRVEITARFRYRISSDRLLLSYALLDPADIARNAFLNHVEQVRTDLGDLGVPVYQGRPA